MGAIVPDPIEEYASRHTTPLPALLEELVAATHEQMGIHARMLSGHTQGTLLQLLVSATGAKHVLEIGTFTGYSALMMAAALPDDGKLIACDVDPNALATARKFIARSEHGHKIEVRQAPALETLKSLQPPFDFVYIDADKETYIPYYEAALPLLNPHGLIAVDNVLQRGRVLDPDDEIARDVAAFNDHVRKDPRVSVVLLPFGDGVTLIRRLQ